MYSLIVTAKMNNVDPLAWLANVLARTAAHPTHRLDELLPWNGRSGRPRSPPRRPDHGLHQQGPPRLHHRPRRQMLGEDEDWLFDVANEMDPEDGQIWVYGPDDGKRRPDPTFQLLT